MFHKDFFSFFFFVLVDLKMRDRNQDEKIIFVGSLLGFLWQEPTVPAWKGPC